MGALQLSLTRICSWLVSVRMILVPSPMPLPYLLIRRCQRDVSLLNQVIALACSFFPVPCRRTAGAHSTLPTVFPHTAHGANPLLLFSCFSSFSSFSLLSALRTLFLRFFNIEQCALPLFACAVLAAFATCSAWCSSGSCGCCSS